MEVEIRFCGYSGYKKESVVYDPLDHIPNVGDFVVIDNDTYKVGSRIFYPDKNKVTLFVEDCN